MNKQIRLIAALSGYQPERNFEHFDIERFAELIVQECIDVVEGGRFLHDEAPTAIFARECSCAIKQHFGVEG
jgi:hypothetical protein